jgi:di/tripeptidase
LKQVGFKPGNSYFFVATVKEELGALGMRAFMNSTQEKVDIAIALDGNLGEVEYGALGIHGRKVIFRGPGAHTMRSKGVPNPNLAVARAVQDILCLAVPETPEEKWTVINIGQIGGGTVTNALSQESFFALDIRSGDQAVLDGLIKEVVKISERIATEMKLQIHHEVFEDSKACQIPGAKESVLVRTAVDVLSYLGFKDIYLTPFGSTDAAASLEKGIPSISLGRASCRKGHTLDEEGDISSFYTGLKQILLVLLSLEGPDGLRAVDELVAYSYGGGN